MIETRVRVLRAEAGTAWVEPSEASGCAACQAKSACGLSGVTSGLGRFFSSRRRPVPVRVADARPGDQLTVAMSEADYLKAGLLAYMLPTVAAVAGGAIPAACGLGDAWSALGAALGFIAGTLLAGWLARPLSRPIPLATRAESIPFQQGETP